MKFHAFHFMPYPYLEEGFKDKYQSDWVTYPNSNYDPVKGTSSTRPTWISWSTQPNWASTASA